MGLYGCRCYLKVLKYIYIQYGFTKKTQEFVWVYTQLIPKLVQITPITRVFGVYMHSSWWS